MTSPAQKKKFRSDLLRIAILGLLVLGCLLLLNTQYVRDQILDVETLRTSIQGHGMRGVLLFLGVSVAVMAIGIPRLWVSAAAGAFYGALEGAPLALLASLVTAALHFAVSRFLLRGPLKRLLPARYSMWNERLSANGFFWLLYLRLFPLSNATVTNILGGISRMRFFPFLAATIIGYTPLTIVFALFGSSAAKGSYLQLSLAIILLAVVVLVERLYRRNRRGPAHAHPDLPAGEPPAGPNPF